MGTISVHKLGGLSLVFGPILAVVSFLIRPGGGLIGGRVDPADPQAAIGVLIANANVAGFSFFLGPIALLVFLFGVRVLVESLKGGNGEALARFGSLFLGFSVVAWLISSACALTIAGGNAGPAAGAVYAVGTGINISGGILASLAFLFISLAISTRDDFNKVFALAVVALSLVQAVLAIMSGRDISMLQTTNLVAGFIYTVTVVWSVTLGLGLMKKA